MSYEQEFYSAERIKEHMDSIGKGVPLGNDPNFRLCKCGAIMKHTRRVPAGGPAWILDFLNCPKRNLTNFWKHTPELMHY